MSTYSDVLAMVMPFDFDIFTVWERGGDIFITVEDGLSDYTEEIETFVDALFERISADARRVDSDGVSVEIVFDNFSVHYTFASAEW